AVLFDGAMLGYLDPLFVLPAAGAAIAAASGATLTAGALLAVALLTKPQAVIVAPAVALAIWNNRPRRRPLGRAGVGAILVTAIATAPVVRAGGFANLLQATSRLGQHDMLSGNACNLWWIVGYVLRAISSMHDTGVWAAFTAPTRILSISRVVELGY